MANTNSSFPPAGKTVWHICNGTAAVLAIVGFLLDTPRNILHGIYTYVHTPDILVTDYFVIGSPGAAFVNASIVMFISIALLWFCKTPFTGGAISRCFLMAGFALFGKNPINILPFFLGVWIYCKIRKLPMGNYTAAALYASALAPIVSDMMNRPEIPSYWARFLLAIIVGALISYIMIPVAEHSFSAHMGYTLFNYGFAGGLIALVFASIMKSLGNPIDTVSIWQTGIDPFIFSFLVAICLGLIVTGLRYSDWSFQPFIKLMRRTGRAPSDFITSDGIGATFVNMGIVGLICISYIVAIGGDLNGPVIGAILTCVGFASCGLHPRNVVPIISGVFLMSLFITSGTADPSMQLAALFGTALAPIAGQFGWVYGIVAGMLHTALVLVLAAPCGGYNLYNNGFSAGLIALIMIGFIQGFSPKWHHDAEEV